MSQQIAELAEKLSEIKGFLDESNPFYAGQVLTPYLKPLGGKATLQNEIRYRSRGAKDHKSRAFRLGAPADAATLRTVVRDAQKNREYRGSSLRVKVAWKRAMAFELCMHADEPFVGMMAAAGVNREKARETKKSIEQFAKPVLRAGQQRGKVGPELARFLAEDMKFAEMHVPIEGHIECKFDIGPEVAARLREVFNGSMAGISPRQAFLPKVV